FSSRRRHTSFSRDWSSDVCSSDLLKRFADLADKSTGSTDMGNVSQVVPAIHPGIHIDSEHSNHHPGFAATTITASGERAIRDGALGMAWTIIDMATQDVWGRL